MVSKSTFPLGPETFYLVLAISLSISIGSCAHAPEDVCVRRVDEFRSDLSSLQSRLSQDLAQLPQGAQDPKQEPNKDPSRDRVLASKPKEIESKQTEIDIATVPSKSILPEFDWMKWAQQRLAQIQDILELTEDHPEHTAIRQELNQLSGEIVNLYGYGQASRWARTIESFDHVQAESEKISRLICGTPNSTNTTDRFGH